MTITRKRVELCPRSYDCMQRAEVDNLHVHFQVEGMPTVRHTPGDASNRKIWTFGFRTVPILDATRTSHNTTPPRQNDGQASCAVVCCAVSVTVPTKNPPPTHPLTAPKPKQVTIKQNAGIGIPGAVYDCSLALAGYVMDEVLPPPPPPAPPATATTTGDSRAAPLRVLELGRVVHSFVRLFARST